MLFSATQFRDGLVQGNMPPEQKLTDTFREAHRDRRGRDSRKMTVA